MANSLLKNNAHNSFADGIYKEILSRSTRYYYFIGKTLSWTNDTVPPLVIDSKSYERDVRNEIIGMKEITPSDIAYVLPRVDWTSGITYDNYDDQYSTEIHGLDITNGGSGYGSAPTITIGTLVPTTSTLILNSQYFYNGFLYTVTKGGTTGASNTVLSGVYTAVYTHGSAELTCVGVQATATCEIGTSGGNNQKVIAHTMTNKGSGYNLIPTVLFSSATTTATATAILVNGKTGAQTIEDSLHYVQNSYNIYVCIVNNGGASTVAPTGISSDYLTTADGYTWKYICSIPPSSKFFTSTFMPVTTANQNQYSATGSIINPYIDNAGAGYDALTTTISVSGDGSGASLTPLITDGRLTGVQINNAGINYTYVNIVVNGTGTGAIVSSSIVSGITLYSNQAQIESSTITGNICSIRVVSGGYGYTAPTISFIGDGTGATATATVLNSRITKITITNRGSNYNWANLIISDSTGAGGSARCILSPFGGLGKDPINQLCCKSLMFYSKLYNNTNQGISVTNDYRQVGIIKDPTRYRDGTYLTSNFATTCWKVNATATISGISNDDIVIVSSNSVTYRFRVVYTADTSILLIPLDNGIPVAGMQFVKSVGVTFTASSVTVPTVDKYSGDMLFIDNESSFIATVDSPTVLRTVINF